MLNRLTNHIIILFLFCRKIYKIRLPIMTHLMVEFTRPSELNALKVFPIHNFTTTHNSKIKVYGFCGYQDIKVYINIKKNYHHA